MSRIESLFTALRRDGRKAFMPFLTAGDPDLEFTADAIREVVRRGCHLVEIGFPYSDPIADGPVIQASYTRALEHHVQVPQIWAMLKTVSAEVAVPLVAMTSYAIVYRHGPEAFVAQAADAGLSGVIVPDLPVEESAGLSALCLARELSLIQLVTPTTPRERAVRIAKASRGFLYYVSIAGITGERTELPPELTEQVRWLRSQTDLPICIGFGISRPEHVTRLRDVADGLIVGSALVRKLAGATGRPRADVLQELGDLAGSLLEALQAPAL